MGYLRDEKPCKHPLQALRECQESPLCAWLPHSLLGVSSVSSGRKRCWISPASLQAHPASPFPSGVSLQLLGAFWLLVNSSKFHFPLSCRETRAPPMDQGYHYLTPVNLQGPCSVTWDRFQPARSVCITLQHPNSSQSSQQAPKAGKIFSPQELLPFCEPTEVWAW